MKFLDLFEKLFQQPAKNSPFGEIHQHPVHLQSACLFHVMRTIDYFRGVNAPDLEVAVPYWLELVEGKLWDDTYRTARSAYNEAQRTDTPITRSFVESGNFGRMVVVSCAPWCNEQRFIRSMPTSSYLAFIVPFREAFRNLSGWERRDFVHWILLEGEDEKKANDISVHLFYMWSFDAYCIALGKQLQQNPDRLVISIPQIAPLSLMTISPSDLVSQLLQEDKLFLNSL